MVAVRMISKKQAMILHKKYIYMDGMAPSIL